MLPECLLNQANISKMTVIVILALLLVAALVFALRAMRRESALDAENRALKAVNTTMEASVHSLKSDLDAARDDARQALLARERLSAECAALQKERERAVKEYARRDAELEERFRSLAAKVLVSNSESLREQNRSGLAEVLAPMRENLEQFRKTFTERYDREATERFSLSERVRELMQLNHAIGLETRKLTDALRGNSKVQGDWGEMILDNILERSGFRRGYEYMVQESVTDADGRRLRPDVVINYTEGRKLIIDSKVSIQDYLRMVNAETEEQRAQYAKAHINSVKKHIGELKGKSYQDVVGTDRVDFVLMFIPHEGAFLAAMKLDESLWQTAFDNRVLVISPTHLMSVIRLVEQVWRHDKQNRNALEIARQAGLMLDKFNGFLADIEKVEKTLGGAGEALSAAISKLHTGPGNLIGKAKALSTLGAKAKKGLPERFVQNEDTDTPETENE